MSTPRAGIHPNTGRAEQPLRAGNPVTDNFAVYSTANEQPYHPGPEEVRNKTTSVYHTEQPLRAGPAEVRNKTTNVYQDGATEQPFHHAGNNVHPTEKPYHTGGVCRAHSQTPSHLPQVPEENRGFEGGNRDFNRVCQQALPPNPGDGPQKSHASSQSNNQSNSNNQPQGIQGRQEREENEQAIRADSPQLNPRRQVTAQIAIAVDDDDQLDEHRGYHQRITGEQAKQRLQRCDETRYLTRYSTKQKSYVLSVHKHEKPMDPVTMHFQIAIQKNPRKFYIKGKTRKFDTIRDLLAHYEGHRLDPDFPTIGRAYTEDDYRRSWRCTIL